MAWYWKLWYWLTRKRVKANVTISYVDESTAKIAKTRRPLHVIGIDPASKGPDNTVCAKDFFMPEDDGKKLEFKNK